MPRRESKKYTPEFQTRAVKMVLEEGKSRAQVAKDLDQTRSALETWMRQSRTDAGQGPSGALTTGEKEELAQLRREVRQLRVERRPALLEGRLLPDGWTGRPGRRREAWWRLVRWQVGQRGHPEAITRAMASRTRFMSGADGGQCNEGLPTHLLFGLP
ncbi:transposase [Myxococcus stipitatus]